MPSPALFGDGGSLFGAAVEGGTENPGENSCLCSKMAQETCPLFLGLLLPLLVALQNLCTDIHA